ncbi:MAG TPA: hypothetical protein VG826_29825 [Pirellulales bacterium]|nr:hypothetical protein [Pirellulales bacterium]
MFPQTPWGEPVQDGWNNVSDPYNGDGWEAAAEEEEEKEEEEYADYRPNPNPILCAKGGMIIGVHTNKDSDDEQEPGEQTGHGHSWLSIYDPKTGVTTYYAAYPDHTICKYELPRLHPESDVTIDAEAKFEYFDGLNYRFHVLTEEEAEKWNNFMDAPDQVTLQWTWTHNCTSFAYEAWLETTGEEIDPDGTFGLEQPAEFGDNMSNLEASSPTQGLRPYRPSTAPDEGAGSSERATE